MTPDEFVCTVERDFTATGQHTPATVLRVGGLLSFATAPVLRHAVLKILTDQPALLLIDVSGVTVVDDITLTALPR